MTTRPTRPCFALAMLSLGAGCAAAVATAPLTSSEPRGAEPALGEPAVVAAIAARSPAAAALRHRARALQAEAAAEAALPSAEFGLELGNAPLARPYALGDAEMIKVELRQRLPAFGARAARSRARAHEARAQLAEATAAERAAARRAAELLADYAQAGAELALVERQLAVLEGIALVVKGRYAAAGAGLVEAARTEAALAAARRGRARPRGDLARAKAALALLLFGDAQREVPPPPPLADETVALPLPELFALARAHRGSWRAAAERAAAATEKRRAEQAERRYPEVVLGAGYWQDPSMRPGYGVTAMVSLPWLWGPARARTAAALTDEAAEHVAVLEAEQEGMIEVSVAHAALHAAAAALVEISDHELAAARRAVEAIAAAYATGGATATEWLEAQALVVELETAAAMLRGDLARGIAALEEAVGAPLPRAPLPNRTEEGTP